MDMEGLDLQKLSDLLEQMQGAIDEMRASMPTTLSSHAEEEAAIDEETAETESLDKEEPADEPKAMKKMALMKIMAKE
jgi:hypothetical protein